MCDAPGPTPAAAVLRCFSRNCWRRHAQNGEGQRDHTNLVGVGIEKNSPDMRSLSLPPPIRVDLAVPYCGDVDKALDISLPELHPHLLI